MSGQRAKLFLVNEKALGQHNAQYNKQRCQLIHHPLNRRDQAVRSQKDDPPAAFSKREAQAEQAQDVKLSRSARQDGPGPSAFAPAPREMAATPPHQQTGD